VSIRTLLLKIVPGGVAGRIEAESRSWMLRCRTCGDERSFWDAGGIRYGARGRPRSVVTCPRCGGRRLHDTFRRVS